MGRCVRIPFVLFASLFAVGSLAPAAGAQLPSRLHVETAHVEPATRSADAVPVVKAPTAPGLPAIVRPAGARTPAVIPPPAGIPPAQTASAEALPAITLPVAERAPATRSPAGSGLSRHSRVDEDLSALAVPTVADTPQTAHMPPPREEPGFDPPPVETRRPAGFRNFFANPDAMEGPTPSEAPQLFRIAGALETSGQHRAPTAFMEPPTSELPQGAGRVPHAATIPLERLSLMRPLAESPLPRTSSGTALPPLERTQTPAAGAHSAPSWQGHGEPPPGVPSLALTASVASMAHATRGSVAPLLDSPAGRHGVQADRELAPEPSGPAPLPEPPSHEPSGGLSSGTGPASSGAGPLTGGLFALLALVGFATQHFGRLVLAEARWRPVVLSSLLERPG